MFAGGRELVEEVGKSLSDDKQVLSRSIWNRVAMRFFEDFGGGPLILDPRFCSYFGGK